MYSSTAFAQKTVKEGATRISKSQFELLLCQLSYIRRHYPDQTAGFEPATHSLISM
jgi:hypothetical protein